MEDKYDEVSGSRDRLKTMSYAIGGIWLLSVLDATVRMPRIRPLGSSGPEAAIGAGTDNGRFTISLVVTFGR